MIIVMGVSGAGKTVVGRGVAEKLGARFADADDFHPPENKAKMGRGEPLTDAERAPWLANLRRDVIAATAPGAKTVLACSALKKAHRVVLKEDGESWIKFVFLRGDFDLIKARIEARQGHYMKSDLLASQFAALEAPTAAEAMIVPIDDPPEMIVAEIVRRLQPLPAEAAARLG